MAKQTFTAGQVLTAAQMTTLQANDYNQTVSAKTASYVLVAADAGTTITMNAAGATTITVNTALFTAGDTLKILNLGAGVCTVTAGTATVSSAGSLALNQYDSGILYFSTSAVSIWDGSSNADVTEVQATDGLTVTSGTGPVPIVKTDGSIIYGYTTTATAGGNTTLTASSTPRQFFTGTLTQTVTLPVTSTLVLGETYEIKNSSTGLITVNSSGGNIVTTINPGLSYMITCILTSGTTAASWDADFEGSATITGSGANVLATLPTITTPSFNGTSLPSSVASINVSSANDILLNSNGVNVVTTNGGTGGVSYFSKSVAPYGTDITEKTANFTVAASENVIRCTGTATITVTLPSGSVTVGTANIGRVIRMINLAAFTVVSATVNVTQITGGAATTAILPATVGSWVDLMLDFTNGWVIIARG
jgi:hypothetical protein